MSKRTLSLLILSSPLLFGVNEASALSSYVNTVATYCNSRGYDLLPDYAGNTCSYCHGHKNEYTSGNYEYFCPAPVVVSPVCTDADRDGYFKEGDICGTQADFNDNSAAAYPGAMEDCSDGIDNDGNGLVDAADPNAVNCSVSTVCTDVDGDGYSIEGGSCGPIDCNDNDPAVSPGAVEVCGDRIDNNCNGSIDTADLNAVGCQADCTDVDGDGFSPDGGNCGPMDCNDSDPAVNPAALENCGDGIDNNCNGRLDGSDGVCQDPQVNGPHWWRPDSNVVNPVPTPNP
ncbi:MAG: putative metal-binding motif-containing protein, partial [Candidatus Thiodiazotropha sp.]